MSHGPLRNKQGVPFHDMEKESPCGLLHGFDKHTRLGCQGRVGKLQGVEVQDSIQDSLRRGRSSTDKNGEGVQSAINYKCIAMMWQAPLVHEHKVYDMC